MKKYVIVLLFGLIGNYFPAKGQWVVTDPTNLAQGIVNSVNQIVETSATATHTLKGFEETVKIFEQGKKYYDGLRAVNNLVKDARKVQEMVLMVGEISELYVLNYQNMLADPNFTFEELNAIAYGYALLLKESSNLLSDLKVIINPSTLSMTDKDRMDMIDRLYWEIRDYRNLLTYYTNKTLAVSFLRSKKRQDMNRLLDLYGLPKDRYW